MELDPLAVALKFGFLAVLYLFLLWVSRSAMRDLRRTGADPVDSGERPDYGYDQGTAMHEAGAALEGPGGMPKLRVDTAPGHRSGAAYDLTSGALLGRGSDADIVLEDSFSSSRHARLYPQGDVIVLEDLGSTNGTYLNGEALRGPQPLHDGDRIRIGDSEFTFER
jgi:FHA domain